MFHLVGEVQGGVSFGGNVRDKPVRTDQRLVGTDEWQRVEVCMSAGDSA